MIVKLIAVQIPALWENIKFCITQADEVPKTVLAAYLNNALQSLLSDKSQCFIRLDDRRTLIALMITSVEIDKITQKSHLHIKCLYSFKKIPDEDWQREYSFIRNFAKKMSCTSVLFETQNESVMRLGALVGFREKRRSFELSLGGI